MHKVTCSNNNIQEYEKIPLKPPYVVAIEKTLNEECNLFKFIGQIFSFCQIRYVCIDVAISEQVHDVGTVFCGICKILDKTSRKYLSYYQFSIKA